MQNESRDFECENAKLHKTVESLRHSLRRLNDLEKENTDLESENHRLDRESKGLHKEIARLKQAIEVCPLLFYLIFHSLQATGGRPLTVSVRERGRKL